MCENVESHSDINPDIHKTKSLNKLNGITKNEKSYAFPTICCCLSTGFIVTSGMLSVMTECE